MALVTDYLSKSTFQSYSLCFLLLVSVGVAFFVHFVIGCILQRRRAVRSVAGVPGPPGHWLKGHIDYVSLKPLNTSSYCPIPKSQLFFKRLHDVASGELERYQHHEFSHEKAKIQRAHREAFIWSRGFVPWAQNKKRIDMLMGVIHDEHSL